jgi:hypothetical protein
MNSFVYNIHPDGTVTPAHRYWDPFTQSVAGRSPGVDSRENTPCEPYHRGERRLDGSRDYSQIRDYGQFGSHPLYDDCGDESVP